ncbi:GntR family transcriptional regulator [Haloactinopolyspora alba]|uniref:GntR family transcriptional regulator n=1 Tax=Haloactinopolyspora alba TaxID=648780 RepID=A0A2P8EG19_9ACTN|nr:FadR/GntR family transcriptional regulator [Haloactinopolyspora alba]PSL08418.1 GntR family transcriptional regulator [Haloactinopolyspora alba]
MWKSVNEAGSVAQRIVAQIEQLLESKELKAGDRLPTERDLAQLVGASRPSVREAVRILQARGRLEVKHGLGVFVLEPAPSTDLGAALRNTDLDVDELFSMREVLEVPAARWAADRITPEQVAQLRAVLDDLDAAFDTDPADFRQLATLDATFHLTIADIADNRFLRQTSHVLHDILISGMKTTLLIPGRREKSRDQHDRILGALEANDAAAAARAARTHIRSAQRAALDRLAAESDSAADAAG